LDKSDFTSKKIDSIKDIESLVAQDIVVGLEGSLLLLQGIIKPAGDVLASNVSSVSKELQGLLDDEVDIPVISFIFKAVTGEKLTLLDAFSLAIACMVTIYYEMAFDDTLFTQSDVKAIKSMPLPWPGENASSELVGVDPRHLKNLQLATAAFWVLYSYFDIRSGIMSLNCDNVEEAWWISLISILWEAAIQACGAPMAELGIKEDKRNSAQQSLIDAWGVWFIPFLADCAAFIDNGKRAEMIADFGPLFVSVEGIVLLGFSADAVHEMVKCGGYSRCTQSAVLLSTFPLVGKIGLYSVDYSGLPLLLDLVCDVSTGALIGADANGDC